MIESSHIQKVFDSKSLSKIFIQVLMQCLRMKNKIPILNDSKSLYICVCVKWNICILFVYPWVTCYRDCCTLTEVVWRCRGVLGPGTKPGIGISNLTASGCVGRASDFWQLLLLRLISTWKTCYLIRLLSFLRQLRYLESNMQFLSIPITEKVYVIFWKECSDLQSDKINLQ